MELPLAAACRFRRWPVAIRVTLPFLGGGRAWCGWVLESLRTLFTGERRALTREQSAECAGERLSTARRPPQPRSIQVPPTPVAAASASTYWRPRVDAQGSWAAITMLQARTRSAKRSNAPRSTMPRRPTITHRGAPEYPMRTRPSPGIVATLEALEVLANSDRPMTFTDVTRSLQASPATVHRVLAMLVERGYAWRSWRTGRFTLALRLFELAHVHDPVSRVNAAIDGRIQRLSEELGQIAYAAMLDDDRLVVVAAAHPLGALQGRVRPGSVMPALFADVGRLLLAHARPNTLPRLLERSREYQRFPFSERIALNESFSKMRTHRCVKDGVGLGPGMHDTAVLMGSGREGLMVAMAVAIATTAGPAGTAGDHAAALDVLRATGETIALELGLTGPSRERPPDR